MINYFKKRSFGFAIVAILIAIVIFTRKPHQEVPGWHSFSKMGYHTYIECTWYDNSEAPQLTSEMLDSAINWFDSSFSESNSWHPFYKLKSSPKHTSVKIPSEIYALFEFMLERLKENKEKGIPNFSLGSSEWLIHYDLREGEPEKSIYPKDSLIQILQTSFFQFNQKDSSLSLEVDSLHVSMGAIVKGYGIMVLQKMFDEAGIENYLINAGGDLALKGHNRSGDAWKIGIQNPRPNENKNLIGVVQSTSDKLFGLATSGDYENYKMMDGKRWHHLINAITGEPITDKQSLTVLAKNALWADYYATYFFLQPIDSVLKWAASSDEYEVFIVDSAGNQHLSENMKNHFTSLTP